MPRPASPCDRRPCQSGFTLVEALVVLVIVGLLALLVAPNLIGRLGKAKGDAAQAQISTLVSAIDLFYIDMGRYPTKEEGLEALLKAPGDDPRWRGPYLRKSQALVDPWGQRFNYRLPGQHGAYDLYSNGSDNAPGGEGDARDLVSW